MAEPGPDCVHAENWSDLDDDFSRKHNVIPIAVVAHQKKVLGGGLADLRKLLREYGYWDPLWYEASSSRETSKLAKRAVADGAQLIFVWGGDGTVQRCIHAVVDCDVELAILPAGTANLLATNLGIPINLRGAVDVALNGVTRELDVGVVNGTCFSVMAGIGFDAVMMERADGKLKERFGRLAYLWTGLQATKMKARKAKVVVDGKKWFSGKTTCILIGQMPSVARGISLFPQSRPDDGMIEVGIVTARSFSQWVRLAASIALGRAHYSPLTQMTQGRVVQVTLDRSAPYEIDGGARQKRKQFEFSVRPRAIKVRAPRTKK